MSDAAEDVLPPEIIPAAAEDSAASTVVSALLFVAFIGLSIVTVGVIYLAVQDFLQKRERDKFEKEEAEKTKKGGKKAKAKARTGPRGYVAPNFMCMIDVAVLVLFMILNSHQMSPNFLLWLVLGVFLMATSLRMYATCQQLQAQAQAHAAAASGFLGGTELRLHVPPSIAFATRGRLQSLRLQLALLDREFDDLDYDALRALDSDNPPDAPSMTEEEINSLPVHKYKLQSSSRQRQDPILYLYIVVDQCCNMHRLLQYLQLR
ncbi:E3 ubiquitin-protein ligase [Musa troglodytarum]|uniref:E3 ubiquitin-protein ligase n=1 Tax=Musa troglodytarum TaxID=320322 RepID=A0A9E7KXN1_9LILI|nr:E3 ubiquitin-protein ligase [Musa troglodytarum]